MSRSIQESDEVKEMYCEPCHRDGFRDICVKGFCTKCVEYLCLTCIRYHKRHLSEHVVEDEKDMPHDFCFDRCQLHPGEIVKFYCKACDDVACSLCKNDQHRRCFDLQHLPKVAAKFEESTELKNLEEKIRQAKNDMNSVAGIIKQENKRAKTLREEVTRAMSRQRNDMNLTFDKCEADIKNTVLKVEKDDQSNLKTQSDRVHKVKHELTSLQSDLDNMKKALQRCKLLVKTKSAIKVVELMKENLKQTRGEISVHDYTYEPVTYAPQERMPGLVKMEDAIRSTDLAASLVSNIHLETRAAIKLVKDLSRTQKYLLSVVMIFLAVFDLKYILVCLLFLSAVGITLFLTKTTRFVAVGNEYINFILYFFVKMVNFLLRRLNNRNIRDNVSSLQRQRHVKTTEIKVKTHKSYTTCNITSLCFLSSNHIAAVDKTYCSVKIIDTEKESVVTELCLMENKNFGSPWDITTLGDNELAVTYPHSQSVAFLEFKCKYGSHMLAHTRSIMVKCDCYGIVHVDGKLIISSCDDVEAIKIFDLNGNILQRYEKDSSDGTFFVLPYYIAVSPAQDTLYVSDYRRSQVTRLSMGGHVMSVYTSSELTSPFGVSVDNTGTVYVCGLCGIHKLTADLTKGQKLIHCEQAPNDIIYNDENNKFYIAFWERDTIKLQYI